MPGIPIQQVDAGLALCYNQDAYQTPLVPAYGKAAIGLLTPKVLSLCSPFGSRWLGQMRSGGMTECPLLVGKRTARAILFPLKGTIGSLRPCPLHHVPVDRNAHELTPLHEKLLAILWVYGQPSKEDEHVVQPVRL